MNRIPSILKINGPKEQLLEQAKRALDEVTRLVQTIEAMG